MKRVFEFEHGIVEIDVPTEEQITRIREATKEYMMKVTRERARNGNSSKSRIK